MIHQFLELVDLNGEKFRHLDESLHFFVVVAVVEKFIESIAGLLSLSYEEKVMFEQLTISLSDCLHRKISDQLDVVVEYHDVVEVHYEQIQNLFVLKVVSAHLVEGVLRTKDVVYQIEDSKTVVYHLHNAETLWLTSIEHFHNELHALEVDQIFLEILAVERYNVGLYKLTPSVLETHLYLAFACLFFWRINFLHDVFINFLKHNLNQLLVMSLFDDAVSHHKSLYPYNFILIPNLLEQQSYEFFFLCGFLIAGMLDADVDLL